MNFFLFSRSWELQLYVNKHETKCTLRTVQRLILFRSLSLTENLRLCSSVEAGIVLIVFLNFDQNESRVRIKNKKCTDEEKTLQSIPKQKNIVIFKNQKCIILI